MERIFCIRSCWDQNGYPSRMDSSLHGNLLNENGRNRECNANSRRKRVKVDWNS